MEHFKHLLIIMVVIYTAGHIFRKLSLPVIFGELLGGILVGPLILNLIDPNSEMIKMLAELGIFFLMLHAGLENNPRELIKSSKKSILIAICSATLPIIGGVGIGYLFGIPFESSFFIGVAMSTTAIAISFRLFKDCKINKTKVAKITIGSALINDIISLILLSVSLDIFETGEIEIVSLLIMLAKVILFFFVIMWIGLKAEKHLNMIFKDKGFTFALIVALVFGLIAETIGLHMIIGAFMAGLFIHEEVIVARKFKKIEDRVYGLSYSFLGPIFFASLAFHLTFENVFSSPMFLILILIIAILGKLIGAGGAALFQKISFKESALIGVAMNSRGAVDLIIASIGLEKGIISQEIFSVLIIMAFSTTLLSIFGVKYFSKYLKKT